MICLKLRFNLKTNSVVKHLIRTHFKFNATQRVQQNNVMKKLMKNNNNLNKYMENDSKPIIVSKGDPNMLSETRDEPKVITRRMKVLNKEFMQCITDVLLTEQIGQQLKELSVRITQVRVGHGCNTLNIYWVTNSGQTEDVFPVLNRLKGKLHQHLVDRNLMSSVPWIQFVLDIQENHSEEINRLLKICDFGPDFEPFDTTMFESPYERVSRSNEKPNSKAVKFENSDHVYEHLSFHKPNDMQMNVFGLDYETLINTVLSNLKKSRAQHRSFNAVADPLPPSDWAFNKNVNTCEVNAVYNTDERIRVMKKFLVENRKLRQKLSRDRRRNDILNQMSIELNVCEESEIHKDFQSVENDFDIETDLD